VSNDFVIIPYSPLQISLHSVTKLREHVLSLLIHSRNCLFHCCKLFPITVFYFFHSFFKSFNSIIHPLHLMPKSIIICSLIPCCYFYSSLTLAPTDIVIITIS